jgi:hypothetical protein
MNLHLRKLDCNGDAGNTGGSGGESHPHMRFIAISTTSRWRFMVSQFLRFHVEHDLTALALDT